MTGVALPPLSAEEKARLEVLESFALMDTPPEAELDDLTRLAATLCEAPIALLSLLDAERQWFKAKVGLELSEIPRAVSFCTHTLEREGLFVVGDAWADARFARNPLVTGEPLIRFYAGVPLVSREGAALGTLCVIDTKPRELTRAQAEGLRALARQVMALFELRRSMAGLAKGELMHAQESRGRSAADRALLFELLEHAPANITLHQGPDHVVIFSNARHQALTGNRELLGKPLAEAMPELAGQDLLEGLSRVYQTGVPYMASEVPARTAGADGREREGYFNLVWQPVRGPAGTIDGVATFSYDVTEQVLARKRAEELAAELRRSEDRYRRIVETAEEGIWALDTEGKTTFCNRKMAEMLGTTVEGMRGRSMFDFMDEDGKAIAARNLQRRLEGVAEQHDFKLQRVDGSALWVLISTNPIVDARGRVTGALGMVTDITARKEAEDERGATLALLDTLLASTPVGLCFIDRDLRYVRINRLLADLLGVSVEQAVGRTLREVIPSVAKPQERVLRHIFETGEPVLHQELSFPAHASQRAARHWLLSQYPVRDKAGAVAFVGMVLVDITERKEAEAERELLLKQREEAIRLRDEFLAVASHELRTPLTPLQLKLQTMKREAQGTQPQHVPRAGLVRNLEVAETQVRKLTVLVSSLLDVARIAQGRLSLHVEEVDLAEVTREVVQGLGPQAQKADCVLEVSASRDVVGAWDRMRLEQVITNLLSNAIKYGAGHPVRVSVERDGARARLRVRDEGIGIEPEALPRLFGKFERAVSDRHYGGLGLGLYIAHQIVEALSGSIRVDSRPGQGATFTVELPLRAEPSAG